MAKLKNRKPLQKYQTGGDTNDPWGFQGSGLLNPFNYDITKGLTGVGTLDVMKPGQNFINFGDNPFGQQIGESSVKTANMLQGLFPTDPLPAGADTYNKLQRQIAKEQDLVLKDGQWRSAKTGEKVYSSKEMNNLINLREAQENQKREENKKLAPLATPLVMLNELGEAQKKSYAQAQKESMYDVTKSPLSMESKGFFAKEGMRTPPVAEVYRMMGAHQGLPETSYKLAKTLDFKSAKQKDLNDLLEQIVMEEGGNVGYSNVPKAQEGIWTTSSLDSTPTVNSTTVSNKEIDRIDRINKLAAQVIKKNPKDYTNEDLQILSESTIKDANKYIDRYKIERANAARKEGWSSPQKFAESTSAIGSKLSLQNIPVVGRVIPNELDVTRGIGEMASGIAKVPQNIQEGNYGQAALNVAIPLATGALAGAGTTTTGQFVHNLVNPLAGARPNYALKNVGSLLNEGVGFILNNKKNKEAIKKGNDWLQNWIQDPVTQSKIDKDLSYIKSRDNILRDEYDLGYEQAKNFIPVSKEYPLADQFVETVIYGQPNIHTGNAGVSYLHDYSPFSRNVVVPNLDLKKSGSWVSRSPKIPQEIRESIAVHEGTHDWTSDFLLGASEQKQFIKDLYDEKTLERLKKWEDIKSQGKDPSKEMGKTESFKAYLSDPTEVHARIMELRKYLNLTPQQSINITKSDAKQIIDEIKSLPKNQSPVSKEFFNVLSEDEDTAAYKLSKLFKRLWAATPAAAAGAATMQQDDLILNRQQGGNVTSAVNEIENLQKIQNNMYNNNQRISRLAMMLGGGLIRGYQEGGIQQPMSPEEEQMMMEQAMQQEMAMQQGQQQPMPQQGGGMEGQPQQGQPQPQPGENKYMQLPPEQQVEVYKQIIDFVMENGIDTLEQQYPEEYQFFEEFGDMLEGEEMEGEEGEEMGGEMETEAGRMEMGGGEEMESEYPTDEEEVPVGARPGENAMRPAQPMEGAEQMKEGGIPQRYRNMGFTKVGQKRQSDRPGKKWAVLAKKGNQYKIVHGGAKGMEDFKQHGNKDRQKRFWDRMGGKDSAKANDPFSPLYWHKRFGTW